jgi:N4-gp56 family major capsid protein
MAKTSFSTNSAETVKLWNEQLFRDTVKASYFSKFMGTGSDSVVQVKTDLEKGKGDRVRFALRMRLEGAGVSEGQTLEGNEESLTSHTTNLTLKQWRHGVRDDGAMSRQRSMFSISEESKSALMDRTTEKIDQECFDAYNDSAPTKTFFGGTATSDATLTTSMLLTPSLISKMKAYAVTGGNRTQTPLRPVMVGGKKHYILLIHPDNAYDLKEDTTWQTAQQNANIRGNGNPIFEGALGMWDNVIVHEHENVPIVTNFGSGANVAGSKCIFLGAQSLLWAWGERPKVVEKKFDYDNECAYSMGMIYDVAKPVFNSLDYGSMALHVARTQIADA